MNRYGLTAQEHWRTKAPSRYSAIEDPETFFTDLGEQVAQQVLTISEGLERSIPADLPYLERVGQLRAVQSQAEEIALADLVFSVEPETTSVREELEQILGDLPSAQMLQEQLEALAETVEAESVDQGFSGTTWTQEQERRRDRLTALLALVSVPADLSTMSEAEVTERILALRELPAPAR